MTESIFAHGFPNKPKRHLVLTGYAGLNESADEPGARLMVGFDVGSSEIGPERVCIHIDPLYPVARLDDFKDRLLDEFEPIFKRVIKAATVRRKLPYSVEILAGAA